MDVKDWVKAARKSRGWTLEQLGEQIARTKANVGHWEGGKHAPSYEQMLRISELTGYPLPLDENPPPPGERLPAAGYVRLPLLGDAAAGAGRLPPIDGELVQYVDVLESWLRESLHATPGNVKVLTARGHSMRGEVEDGDLLFVEPCTTFGPDGLYVLSVEDVVRVKRLRVRMLDRQLSIESNDGSAPELASLADVGERIQIHGRVIGAWNLKKL